MKVNDNACLRYRLREIGMSDQDADMCADIAGKVRT